MKSKAVMPTSQISPRLQRKCDCGSKSSGAISCPKCGKDEDRNLLQRKSASDREVGEVPQSVYDVLRSPGQPLDAETRAFFEPRFGQDFSRVRVHANQQAADSARGVNARAYTVGSDIAFGSGEYAPTSNEGKRLLAHELTHVVQQRGEFPGSRLDLEITADTSLEDEATRVSNSVASTSFNVGPHLTSPVTISRQISGRDKSRRSRPRNAPRGTVPIDESDLTHEEIHSIKDFIGARPTDWVGVTPDGHIITTDEEGNAEEHGKTDQLLPGGTSERRNILSDVPNWIWGAIVAAGLVTLVAGCFMSGVCAFAAVTAGLGAAAAASLILLLKARGVRDDSQA